MVGLSNRNLIVSTRSSRLGQDSVHSSTPQDLYYEALSALAESLELLGQALEGLVGRAGLDPQRHARLEERAAQLERLCADAAESAQARSIQPTVHGVHGIPLRA